MEIIKDIEGFEGRYKVSNLGNVYSHYKNGKVLKMKPQPDKQGYLRVELRDKAKMIHRLVASAFIGEIPIGFEVNHLDCNPSNNKLSNLEICTPSQNMKHAYKFGSVKIPDNSGEKNGRSKLTNENIVKIRELLKQNIKTKNIAKLFGVSTETICAIKRGDRWGNCV